MMKGGINWDYEHSPDPYNRHSALYIYLQEIELHNLTNFLSYIHLFRELA